MAPFKFWLIVLLIVGLIGLLEFVARWCDQWIPDNTDDRYGPDSPSPLHLPRIRR